MSQKRPVIQPAREMHFAGLEPNFPHNAGLDISTQQTLTPAPSGTNMILMQSQDQAAFYTLDGTVPVGTGSTIGFLMAADAVPVAIPVGRNCIVIVVEGAAGARFQYQWTE